MTIYAIPDPIINSKDPLDFLHCLHFDHVMDRPIKGEVLAKCHRLELMRWILGLMSFS